MTSSIIHINWCKSHLIDLETQTNLIYFIIIVSLPWNDHHLAGYIANIIFGVCFSVAYLMMSLPFLLFFISICEYHHAFYEMFQLQIDRVRKVAQSKPYRSYDVKKSLADSISFHISAKE